MVTQVLLVDDHPVVRSGFRRLLEREDDLQVLDEAGDADSAYRSFCLRPADVTLTDLNLPGASGLDLIRRMLGRDARARVLVCSVHDSAVLVRRALDAGALGFVAKSEAAETLVQAVRNVARGLLVHSAIRAAGAVQEAHRLGLLTEREFALFRLLAQGHALADCADLLGLSPKTLSNYQTQIKDKLGVSTSAAMAHLAIRHGIVRVDAG